MNKKRNWAFVLYPESAPIDWQDILTQSGVEWACSPLHDKDINPTGEKKKEHYHIILCYPGPTTYNVVKTIVCDRLNQPIPLPLESVKGMYRYFTHKDNPEKYQYNDRDIKIYNGFDINVILNTTEVFQKLKFINSFIRDNDITEFSQLIDLLQDNDSFEELNVCLTHTIYLNTYISSRRYSIESRSKEKRKVNGDINEVKL